MHFCLPVRPRFTCLVLQLSMGALEVGGATNGCYVNGNGGYCNGGGGGGSGGAVGRLGSGFNGEEDTANSEGKASKGSSRFVRGV